MSRNTPQRITARELRGQLLDACGPLIEHKMAQALGKPSQLDLSLVVKEQQIAIWECIVPMMQQAGDIVAVTAQSTRDVLRLIEKGKVTFDEATQLMAMLKTDSDVQDIKRMADRLDEIAAGASNQHS